MTTLRKKNFDFRSKITELEDKSKADNNANNRDGSRNRRAGQRHGGNELALARELHR